MKGLKFRHLTEATLGEMIDVLAKARADDPYERRLTMDKAKEFTFLDPDFDSAGSWFAELDGSVVGFGSCLVASNRIAAGKDDAHVEVDVVPDLKGEGIEQALLERLLGYVQSRGVGSALFRSLESDERTRSFLTSNGFREDYRVFILVRRGQERAEGPMLPDGFRLERKALADCSDGDLEMLSETFNDSFSDHYNFAPERAERFMTFRDCSSEPRVFSLAVRGDEIAGFSLSQESSGLNLEKGGRVGWIDVLGVRPSVRRLGIGRALLADSINWILDRAMDTVYLGVFARNERALGLYKSFDFSKERESIWFRKNLR